VSNQVYNMRQVARSPDDDSANLAARVERAAVGIGQLVRRAGEIVEEWHELGAEAPERHARQLLGIGERFRQPHVDRRPAAAGRDCPRRAVPFLEEPVDRPLREDVVGSRDQRR
jgi:hypothetical protein